MQDFPNHFVAFLVLYFELLGLLLFSVASSSVLEFDTPYPSHIATGKVRQCSIRRSRGNCMGILSNPRIRLLLFLRRERAWRFICAGANRITIGRVCYVAVPMVIFVNLDRSSLIQGFLDAVQGVCYRSQPRGWIDQSLFAEYFTEKRTIISQPNGVDKKLYVDSCRVYNTNNARSEAVASM